MVTILAALIAVITLGAPFGEATVEGAPVGDRLRVEFEVAVGGTPAAVVVHVVDPGQTQEAVSLADRGGGVWGGVVDLDQMDYVVVFEVLYPDGDGSLSEPTTLLQLGLDPASIGMGDPGIPDEDDEGRPLSALTRRWGWGAIALGAVSLALLAVWALGGRAGKAKSESSESTAEDQPLS